ncbi:hypothetical protein EVJ50_05165 [Synechococcus sp. RSCCF101]|uniref:hypothetical protein n=1 Tax=Synechococcus sp. RSCCF101 TaxID=2511069 RepID=UPI00124552FD|nr:hypothetical protein [Synechococcus sp. RSCCF101]QEY31726.1 hypothetical protein EVJ50_05165 [Synechococcus sp. RSCCF101]
MGLLDGLFRKNKKGSAGSDGGSGSKEFFLDADASTSLGDVNYMRRSNTIRHTFPGTADNPGNKEMVQEVDSMAARTDKVSEGLPVAKPAAPAAKPRRTATPGVPKQVKKTFASPMSQAQLQERLRGSAVKPANAPAPEAAAASAGESASEATAAPVSPSQQPAGSIDPFRNMARDLNS